MQKRERTVFGFYPGRTVHDVLPQFAGINVITPDC
jgi:hypothetical protein